MGIRFNVNFDRTRLHCSSSIIEGKKIGLTTFNLKKKIIQWQFMIVFNKIKN